MIVNIEILVYVRWTVCLNFSDKKRIRNIPSLHSFLDFNIQCFKADSISSFVPTSSCCYFLLLFLFNYLLVLKYNLKPLFETNRYFIRTFK